MSAEHPRPPNHSPKPSQRLQLRLNALADWSAPAHLLVSLCGLVLIAFLDYQTGVEIQFFLFYSFPIAYVTWFTGRMTGLWASIVALCFIWLNNYYWHTSPPSMLISFWNLSMRLLFFVMVSQALSILRRSYDYLQKWAETDPLTELKNRRVFFERFELAYARCQRNELPLTIVYLDLDHFKQVNDNMGHHEGDLLLQAVAETLVAGLRKTDLIARLGGDEFALVLEDSSAAQAKIVIERLQEKLNQAMQAHHWPVSFSIGMYSFHRLLDSPKEMLQRADKLMYEVKHSGRGRIKAAVYPREKDINTAQSI